MYTYASNSADSLLTESPSDTTWISRISTRRWRSITTIPRRCDGSRGATSEPLAKPESGRHSRHPISERSRIDASSTRTSITRCFIGLRTIGTTLSKSISCLKSGKGLPTIRSRSIHSVLTDSGCRFLVVESVRDTRYPSCTALSTNAETHQRQLNRSSID